MGYLLKEALKTLCGVNQWSYAVFWKIGCQNPKLLIWEDCYYEAVSCSSQDYNASWVPSEANLQAGAKLHMLVNKMMMDNHVNIVGEGLVGRVAFTGNHQWILSQNYFAEVHPPEVLKEACQQFSAGMQTVAVIPVLPHGVVQFGSFMTILEDTGFVNNVASLIHQLGHVSGVLLSANYEAKEHAPRIGVPVGSFSRGGITLDSNGINAFDSFNYVGNSCQSTRQPSFSLAGEILNGLHSNGASFQLPNSTMIETIPQHSQQEAKMASLVRLNFSSNQSMNGVAKAEFIPSNSEVWKNHHSSVYIPRTTLDIPSGSASTWNCCTDQKFLSDSGNQGHFNAQNASSGIRIPALGPNSGLMYTADDGSVTCSSVQVCNVGMSNVQPISGVGAVSEANWAAANENINSEHPSLSVAQNAKLKMEASNSDSVVHFDSHSLLAHKLNTCKKQMGQNVIQVHDIPLSQYNEHLNMGELVPAYIQDDSKHKDGSQVPYMNAPNREEACVQPESGDDLFDVLGADFKNKLFSSCWNSCLINEATPNIHEWDSNNVESKKCLAASEIYSTSQGNTESGIFSSAGSDHLLEAIVSKMQSSTKPSMDDTVSCRTTLTNISGSSVPNTSLPYGRFGTSNSDHLKGELLGVPKYLAKGGAMSSCSKEESGTYSQGSSIYGSQISSWIEKDQRAMPNNSVSTGHSKKPHEPGKTNRKRLKPGENPRPRPKDRQMIQDRVKELREIVPNGAKCSIDALLERTIKHMLFLQSVTKHADKLKQTGESKIMSKDGGLLLKDNYEGGATWAYEVGSQSMVCPIIVEDLNQPRQMFVEMLCEERGLFLEIADIIRGLGLTILKGVMETRNDKIWARFAVEANRDVTRMEIFISLVRLLEQSSKTVVAQPNGITSSDNLMA